MKTAASSRSTISTRAQFAAVLDARSRGSATRRSAARARRPRRGARSSRSRRLARGCRPRWRWSTLGGHPIYIRPEEIGLGTRETVEDVARTLAGFCAVIAARVFDHDVLESMAAAVDIPVVNLLSDRAHPCQAVADFLTLRELFGELDGRRLVFVGDGNNVAASLAFAAALTGVELTVASPPGYELDEDVVDRARNLGAAIELVADPYEAVKGADAVYTDVWTSMGQEAESRSVGWRSPATRSTPRSWRWPARRRRVPALPPGPPRRGGHADVIDGPQSWSGSRPRTGCTPRRGALAGRRSARDRGRDMATLGKPQRQHRIARLLEEQAVSSQSQLVELLASDGVVATQATVSRDLEELGAVKVRIPGGTMAYAIPEHAKERSAPDDHLRRVMGEFVVEVSHSGEPGRVAHAARLRARHRLRARPRRPRRRAGYGRRRRHADPGLLRAGGGAAPKVAAELAGLAGLSNEPRIEEGTSCPKRVVLAYSGGLDTSVAVRWIARGVGRGGRRDGGRRRPVRRGRLGRDPRRVRWRPARWRRSSSTPSASSPTTTSCPRSRPTRSTRASTRSSRRCRAR